MPYPIQQIPQSLTKKNKLLLWKRHSIVLVQVAWKYDKVQQRNQIWGQRHIIYIYIYIGSKKDIFFRLCLVPENLKENVRERKYKWKI